MLRILGFDPSIARYGARRGWGEARKQLTKVDEIRKMTVRTFPNLWTVFSLDCSPPYGARMTQE